MEEMTVTITAGGDVTRERWASFVRGYVSKRPGIDIVDGRLVLQEDREHGDTEEDRVAMREHGVSYEACCDAGGGYSGEVRGWAPGMADEVEAGGDQDGNATVTVSSLVEAEAAGRTIADVLRDLGPLVAKVPPMTIDGRQVAYEDLEEPDGDEGAAAA